MKVEKQYLVQRIAWVTTGWKGPCIDYKDNIACKDMRGSAGQREESIRKKLKKCDGCSECEAFKKWKWYFNPPMQSPRELPKGSIILVISRYKDNRYYAVGLGFVNSYWKGKTKGNWGNKLKCDPKNSIAFSEKVPYEYGKIGYPETADTCHKEITEKALTKILVDAKRIHEERDRNKIVRKIIRVIKKINNGKIPKSLKENPPTKEIIKNIEKERKKLLEDSHPRATKEKLIIIDPKHKKLSNKFKEYLEKIGAEDISQEEKNIDITFYAVKKRFMVEIKICDLSTKKNIREAIGQLLDYNHYPNPKKETFNQWLIITDKKPSNNDIEFIESISEKYKLPLNLGWLQNKKFEFMNRASKLLGINK